MKHTLRKYLRNLALFVLVCLSFNVQSSYSAISDQEAQKVFEMRTYTTFDGKLPELNARFKNHTLALFKKHDMDSIGYWVPTDKPNTLIYIVSHKSKNAAAESWKNFIADPQWRAAYADSIKNGKLVSNIESIFMTATDYSLIN